MAITSEGMTKVRVAELVHLAATEALREQATLVAPGQPGVSVQRAFEIPAPPAGRAGPADEHLRALSVIYTVAYASGGNPRQAVMDRMRLTRTTANRWIRTAREGGYLTAGRTDDGDG